MVDTNASRMRTKLLLSRAANAQLEDSTEEFEDADTRDALTPTRVRLARSGYGTLPVYKLTPNGSVRIPVAVQSIAQVLGSPGYSAECPDCQRDDCLYDTEIPGEVSSNSCPGKASRLYRICPVRTCAKTIYDKKPTGLFKVDEFDRVGGHGAGEISDDAYNTSTPETRTKAAMDIHVIGFHPQESMELNVARPAQLPQMAIVS